VTRLRLSPDARLDLEDIFVRGALDFGLASAERYVDGLRSTLLLIGDRRQLGKDHAEVSPPVRLHRHKSHHILYVVREDHVLILRVLHGSANWIDHL